MTTVFLKSTVRPWPSVSRPSSSTWSRTLKTSGCAFSISSKQDHAVRPAAHRLGELAALLVADVAGRRADQPRDGVLLHVLAHVDAHHRLARRRRGTRRAPCELGLADAGRAEEEERADRPVRVAEARAGAAHGVRRPRRPPRPGRRRARREPLLHVEELLASRPRSSFATGMPVHLATTSAMSSSSTSSLSSAALGWRRRERSLAPPRARCSRSGSVAVAGCSAASRGRRRASPGRLDRSALLELRLAAA